MLRRILLPLGSDPSSEAAFQTAIHLAQVHQSSVTSVAVVDTIGDLEGVYGLADLVFVGGSLVPHGGQNMLEPAAAGRATLYGPHVENFREEAELLERDGASVRLEGPEGLGATLRDLLGDEQRRARMSRTGMAAVASQTGASRRTLEALLERGLIPVAP